MSKGAQQQWLLVEAFHTNCLQAISDKDFIAAAKYQQQWFDAIRAYLDHTHQDTNIVATRLETKIQATSTMLELIVQRRQDVLAELKLLKNNQQAITSYQED